MSHQNRTQIGLLMTYMTHFVEQIQWVCEIAVADFSLPPFFTLDVSDAVTWKTGTGTALEHTQPDNLTRSIITEKM